MGELAGYSTKVVSVGFASGTVDASLPLFPAPFGGVTVKAAWAVTQDAVAANGSNYLDVILINGGTSGTATTAIGTAAAAGTAGWAAATPKAITLNASADELTVGQWLVAKYDVTGSITAPGNVRFVVHYVDGKG